MQRLSHLTLCAFCLSLKMFAASALAEPPALAEIEDLLADRNYPEAIAQLQAALRQPPENADYLALLLGNAYFYQQDYPNAIQTYQRLAADYPASAWRQKALFGAAESHVRAKQFREAGDIYLPAVTQLVSPERKERLASVYLNFAEEFFTGAWVKRVERQELETRPDYARAKTFYELALQMELSPATAEDARFQIARCAYESGGYDEASARFAALQTDYPQGARLTQTAYYLGQSYLKQGDLLAARRVLRDFIRDYPQAAETPEAAYLISRAFRLPSPASSEELELGIQSLREFLAAYPNDPRAPQADFEIGLSNYNFRRHEDAAAALTAHLQKYDAMPQDSQPAGKNQEEIMPPAETLPLARYYLGLTYQQQRKFPEAIAVWQEFLQKYPSHSQWSEAQRQIIETELLIAETHFEEKRYDDARAAWEQFLSSRPLDPRNPEIMRRIGDTFEQQERFQDAIAQWKRAVSKYPQTEPASQAQFDIGRLLETTLLKVQEAYDAYKLVTWGARASAAQERMNEMQAKRLDVVTERVFRSNETPMLKVTTRNIEKLTFKMYNVDLATYFRKTQTTEGVDKLDIALIDPDLTWQETIAGYEKYRKFENQFAMKFSAPGAYLVTCSEESAEKTTGYEATAFVLVSDLDVIAKSTKRDALIFAQNMRTGAAQPGVKFLFSDGEKIFFEGATQADGVFHHALDALENAPDFRVFAYDGKHYAATTLDLAELRHVKATQARGYIYTDRPAYRPGQQVNIKGILREADASGALRVPQAGNAAARYAVSVLNSQGATVFQDETPLTEFGSFALDFSLSPAAPTGEYRMLVARGDAESYSGAFRVEQYKLEKLKLTIETDRDVYFRGETITGTIRAAYYYGEPAREKAVSYALAGVETLSGVTDANGEIPFSLSTRDFAESQTITLTAQLDDENAQTGKTVWLATRGFACEVNTIRRVYLAGEDIEVKVKTTDPAGKPQSQAMTLLVLRKETTPRGEPSEVNISEQAVTTGDDGSGRAMIRLEQGGDYIVRAAGRDRFDHPVSGETALFISGKEDDIHLRFITDAEEFKVGDAPDITLFSRAADGLGLLTYEGEAILSYQILPLRNGKNPLTLRIADEHAPNFTLSVAQMAGNKLHQAQKEFSAIRQLRIALSVKQPEQQAAPEFFKPAETVSVDITTTDQNGKPVAAELSLAMVDEALFARYADALPPIGSVFYDQRREFASKVDSSCVFEFEAETREIVSEIVEEEQRAAEEIELLSAPPSPMEEGRADFKDGLLSKMEADISISAIMPAPPKMAMDELAANAPMTGDKKQKRNEAATGKEFLAALRDYFPETGYWNPRIVTDADGKAVVAVKLPDSTTEWRFTSRGVTQATLVGDATSRIVTKLPFFAEIKTPAVFTEGDRATLLATAHNGTGADQEVALAFTARRDAEVIAQQEQTVSVKNQRVAEAAYSLDLSQITDARTPLTLELTATAGAFQDRIQRVAPVQAWGVEYAATKSGAARDDQTVEISLPAGRSYVSRQMTIRLNPSLDRALLDLAEDRPCPRREPSSSSIHQAVALLYALRYSERPENMGMLTEARLRFKALLNDIQQRQNPDGGWNWAGVAAQSDLFVSADAVSLLAEAKRIGWRVRPDVLQNGLNYLKREFQSAAENEIKTYLLYALTVAGDVDFAHVNRVYRERNSLRAGSLALLALMFHRLNRPELAAEINGMLTARATRQTDSATGATLAFWPSDSPFRWLEGDVETTALALLAAQTVAPQADVTTQAMEWLNAQRAWIGWGSTRANARVAAALFQHLTAARFAEDRYTLDISVNGAPVKRIEVNGSQAAQTLDIPAELLRDQGNAVRFAFEGRGAANFVCVLKGVSRDMAETRQFVDAHRFYEPAPLTHKGREIPRGFSVLEGSYATWRNALTQIPLGGFGRVTVEYSRRQYDDDQPYRNQPLIIEEPIPAGGMVLEQTIQGNVTDYEIRDGKLTLYLQNASYGAVTYDLYGYMPGAFRVLPTKILFPYAPERFDYGAAYNLTVLPRGEAVSETYKQTPDELYYYGKALFDDKRLTEARPLLTELFETHRLRSEPYRDTAKMLMYIAIAERNSRDIVRFFEVLKEKYPDLVLSFADILRVAEAYAGIEEFEREAQVLRATAEASFLKDVQVSGTLEAQGQFLPSVEYTRAALLEYPDLPVTESAFYGLSQLLYSEAESRRNAPLSAKPSRQELLRRAIAMLREFLTRYPEQPIADEVSFSLANAYLDLEEFETVAPLARRFRQRYPKSAYLSGYEYLEGYADFELERYDDSLKLCQNVAAGNYPDKQGNLRESDHKYLAMYLMGQMYHAMGKPEQALAHYEQVKDRFPDAAEAMAHFTRKGLKLEDVTTFAPGEQAALTLRYRNVKEVDARAYRVDLMKFYLLQKNLNDITNINLAGITPYYQATTPLGDGKDYAEKTMTLTLPLKKEGAYLIVVKEAEIDASGLALISPLRVDVDEDAESGRARVNVSNRVSGGYENNAHVKVIGSDDREFISGSTDLRGIFIADNLHGVATVIARKGDQYAFYRGKTALQPSAPDVEFQPQQQVDMRSQATQVLRESNLMIQQQSAGYLRQQLYQNTQQGVEVQATY